MVDDRENLHQQDTLEYDHNQNEQSEQSESHNLITDSYVTDVLQDALLNLWTVNPQLSETSPPLPRFPPRPQNHQRQIPVFDDQLFPELQVTPDILTNFLTLSTNPPLKKKRRKLHFPMDFGELNVDGLIDTSLLSNTFLEAELRKTRFWLHTQNQMKARARVPNYSCQRKKKHLLQEWNCNSK